MPLIDYSIEQLVDNPLDLTLVVQALHPLVGTLMTANHENQPQGWVLALAQRHQFENLVSRFTHDRHMLIRHCAAAPLNLANSPSLHLLTPAEQTLCSQLRILPKPYLVIKEILVREYARRGGKLRRREARDLVKIDVTKTSRVWDFLVQAGYLKITTEPAATTAQAPSSTLAASQNQGAGYG